MEDKFKSSEKVQKTDFTKIPIRISKICNNSVGHELEPLPQTNAKCDQQLFVPSNTFVQLLC